MGSHFFISFFFILWFHFTRTNGKSRFRLFHRKAGVGVGGALDSTLEVLYILLHAFDWFVVILL